SEAEDLFGVQDDDLRAPLFGLRHHVTGAAGAIAGLLVPERDQGNVLAARRQRVEKHPEVAALPNVVVGLVLKPARQLLHPADDTHRARAVKAIELLDPRWPRRRSEEHTSELQSQS